MKNNIHPRRLQPQFQSCYKLSPTRDVLFRLLELCSSHGMELVRRLPAGFYMFDIFDCLLQDIVNRPSAEDGQFYIFTHLKIQDSGQHDCKTVDGGSWKKQLLKYNEQGRRVQSAAFFTNSKERTMWSMDLYSFHGQELALCVIRNTNAKRKADSSNDKLRPRPEQPFHQEEEHTRVDLLDRTVHDATEPIYFPWISGGGLESNGPAICSLSTSLPHQENFEESFQNYGVGMTGSSSGIIQAEYHHDIVTDTAGSIQPTSEICTSSLGTNVVEHREGLLGSSASNFSSHDSSIDFDFNFNFDNFNFDNFNFDLDFRAPWD